MSFTVATYNVLATGYIRRKFYPRTPAELLAPAWRLPALAWHVAALEADVVCLQEVDPDIFAAIESALAPRGYAGHYAPRQGRKPDGCAAFVRPPVTVRDARRHAFADGSGHIVQLLDLTVDARRLGIANTHLKWSASDIPVEAQPPMRQAAELLGMLDRNRDGWILCGDFNMTPDTAVIDAVRRGGFTAAHRDITPGYTCNPNGRAKTIDYLFHSAGLAAQARPLPAIDDATPLPSPEQPSDHLALVAAFDWTVAN